MRASSQWLPRSTRMVTPTSPTSRSGTSARCPAQVCEGVLKPDVVFFGEAVPPLRVEHCRELVRGATSLLVLGSSLTVMSGLRFVRQAAQAGKPVLIVNRDPTRGDRHAVTRIALPLGTALSAVAGQVGTPLGDKAAGPA